MHKQNVLTGVFAATMIASPMMARAGFQAPYDGVAKPGSYCYSEEEAAGKDLAYRVFILNAPANSSWDWDTLPGEDECKPTRAEQTDSHCWFDVMGGYLYHCEIASANNTDGCMSWGSGWYYSPDLTEGIPNFTSCTTAKSGRNTAVCKGTIYTDEIVTANFECQIKYDYSYATYGCRAGYYASSGSSYQDIICTACPNSGQSVIGNTSISGCYIPVSGSCSDETGDCTVENGNCYYKP